ncbi:MAG: hypothetical protein LRY38_07995 [Aeromonadaceae bacterium]|nr:hypothetical protein [Aeromonadaceae bacterium]
MKIHPVWGLLLGLPLPSQALPIKAALDTALVGGGTMLFVAGLIMLVIPRWFKTGVLVMLLADALFVSRMLMLESWQTWLRELGWEPWILGLSRDGARLVTLMAVLGCLLCLWSVRRLLMRPVEPAGAPRRSVRREPQTQEAGRRRGGASRSKLRMHDYPDP